MRTFRGKTSLIKNSPGTNYSLKVKSVFSSKCYQQTSLPCRDTGSKAGSSLGLPTLLAASLLGGAPCLSPEVRVSKEGGLARSLVPIA